MVTNSMVYKYHSQSRLLTRENKQASSKQHENNQNQGKANT
jgi:hypothetical protein